jgi:hypothetical protein
MPVAVVERVAQRDPSAGVIAMGRVACLAHGAELEHLERCPAPAQADLAEQNWPAVKQPNRQRHQEHQRRGKQQKRTDQDQIENALFGEVETPDFGLRRACGHRT